MKTFYKTLFASAALACASGVVSAQSPVNEPQNLSNTDYTDLNGDGVIDRSEVRPGSQLEKRFATRDKNGDGRLSTDEYKVVQRGDTTPSNLPNSANGNSMGSNSSTLGQPSNNGLGGPGDSRRGGAASGGGQGSGAGNATGGNASGADGASGNSGK